MKENFIKTVGHKKTGFFLITAMHQLINVFEASDYFSLETKESHLLVMLEGPEKFAFQTYLDPRDWGSVVYMPRWHLKKYGYLRYIESVKLFHICVEKINREILFCDFLFYCQYDLDYSNHLANVLKYNKAVLLDEGNGSIKYSELRANHIRTNRKQRSYSRIIKKYLLRFKLSRPKTLTFFSTYELFSNPVDEFVSHNYAYIGSKRVNRQLVREEKVVFLGAPLVVSGIVDEEYYISLVSKVVHLFRDAKVVYRPHRNESPDLVNRLALRCALIVERSIYPIELELLKGGGPNEVISFYSAALNNINLIFGPSVHCNCIEFNFDNILTNRDRKQAIDVYGSYKRLESEYFKIYRV